MFTRELVGLELVKDAARQEAGNPEKASLLPAFSSLLITLPQPHAQHSPRHQRTENGAQCSELKALEFLYFPSCLLLGNY